MFELRISIINFSFIVDFFLENKIFIPPPYCNWALLVAFTTASIKTFISPVI